MKSLANNSFEVSVDITLVLIHLLLPLYFVGEIQKRRKIGGTEQRHLFLATK